MRTVHCWSIGIVKIQCCLHGAGVWVRARHCARKISRYLLHNRLGSAWRSCWQKMKIAIAVCVRVCVCERTHVLVQSQRSAYLHTIHRIAHCKKKACTLSLLTQQFSHATARRCKIDWVTALKGHTTNNNIWMHCILFIVELPGIPSARTRTHCTYFTWYTSHFMTETFRLSFIFPFI